MNILTEVHASSALGLNLDLDPVEEVPTEAIEKVRRNQLDVQDWENNPATASWGPLMQEVCGVPGFTLLHIHC